MRKFIGKKLIAAMLTAVTVFSTAILPACAEGNVQDWFDFDKVMMQIAPGGQFTQRMRARERYRVFQTGNTSKQTRVGITGNSGNNQITFYVGEDETAKRVLFHFYTWDHDIHDTVIVDVVGPVANNPATQTALTAALPSAEVTYLNGAKGSVSAVLDNKAALISDANGTPRAAFAVLSKEGTLCSLQVCETVTVEGFPFPSIRTIGTADATGVSIQETDKAAARAAGIYGIFLNGKFVFWD